MSDQMNVGGIVADLSIDQGPATAALDKVNAELVKTEDKIRRVQGVLNAYGDTTGQVGAKLEQLARRHADLAANADMLARSAEQEAKAVEKLDNAFEKLAETQAKQDKKEAEWADKRSARAEKILASMMTAAAKEIEAEKAARDKAEADQESALNRATAARLKAAEVDRASRERDLQDTLDTLARKVAAEDAAIAAAAEKRTKANVGGANFQLGQMVIQPGELERLVAAEQADALAKAQQAHAGAAAANVQARMNAVLAEGATMEKEATATVANHSAKLQELASELQKTSRSQMGLTGNVGTYTTQMNQGRGATENVSYAMLHLSHAFQDAQYGFGAVLNNIPLIVQAMGGGPGLAGTIMTVGVAINIAKPLIGDLDVALGLTGDKAAKTGATLDDLKAKLEALTNKGWKVKVDYDAIDDTKRKIEDREKAQQSFEANKESPAEEFVRKVAEDKTKDAGGAGALARMAAQNEAAAGRDHADQSDINESRNAKKFAARARERGGMLSEQLAKDFDAKAAAADEKIRKANEEFAVRKAGEFSEGKPEAVQYFRDIAKNGRLGLSDKQSTAINSVPYTKQMGEELADQQSPRKKAEEARAIAEEKAAKKRAEGEDKSRAESHARDVEGRKQNVEFAKFLVPDIKSKAEQLSHRVDNGLSRESAVSQLKADLVTGRGPNAGMADDDAHDAADLIFRESQRGTNPEQRAEREAKRQQKAHNEAGARHRELLGMAEEAVPGIGHVAEGAAADEFLAGTRPQVGRRARNRAIAGFNRAKANADRPGSTKAQKAKYARSLKRAGSKLDAAVMGGSSVASADKKIREALAKGGLEGKDLAAATDAVATKGRQDVSRKVTDGMNGLHASERVVNSEVYGTSDLTHRIQSGVSNGNNKIPDKMDQILKVLAETNDRTLKLRVN